eukprot:CAMPEP_0179477036 /NCGR_PEP_ID=MMETSP0799-20121207/55908_1 /TAXON_ID=46947 /ORGANISM="Geminigera cryophila, Strain CCMP2564" /LENGTH=138 /DNA_ID=CAMNT_0021287529 /DNA_START=130 /DNA_END=546 /DNA_ORIENTATION=+
MERAEKLVLTLLFSNALRLPISSTRQFLKLQHALLLAVVAIRVRAATIAVVGVAGGRHVHSAHEVVAGVLSVELSSAVEAKVAADTMGVGRGATTTRLGGEESGAALLACKADVGRRARVAEESAIGIKGKPGEHCHV